MAIQIPGKRFGKRLQHSKVFGHGGHAKRSGYADLLITPLVDMFVIIVLFLIANFSATGEVMNMRKDIQLPEAANVQEIELQPVILVSADTIMVDGNMIGNVADLSKEEYLNIPALEEKLREMKRNYENLHANLGNDEANQFKGDINIQADRALPFGIVKRVMYSCATAGYNNINFATLTLGDDEGVEGTQTASAL